MISGWAGGDSRSTCRLSGRSPGESLRESLGTGPAGDMGAAGRLSGLNDITARCDRGPPGPWGGRRGALTGLGREGNKKRAGPWGGDGPARGGFPP
ncbi:hypothetical protein SAV14893_025300 [Streptomyces avermitilis]|uniref:Uncharacterized protein n=1 Tax=Streptomyces avermitilis TaxID=33903 RepID=A0A4D4LXY5_STRAX|nr:hypothetical protein SAVMC3_37320 [Streptomyces avermitilis]GDY63137.1 hypothetical protein SAV14893_025300 [Streptomyces avermitilis]GDY76729.1 hypothetical protein SAV31267_062140 [Streptomyces avermitilis]